MYIYNPIGFHGLLFLLFILNETLVTLCLMNPVSLFNVHVNTSSLQLDLTSGFYASVLHLKYCMCCLILPCTEGFWFPRDAHEDKWEVRNINDHVGTLAVRPFCRFHSSDTTCSARTDCGSRRFCTWKRKQLFTIPHSWHKSNVEQAS
jgi:hypothetical protein